MNGLNNTTLSHEEAKWAFGDGYVDMLINNGPKAWNSRHGDLFIINSSDSVAETEKLIKQAFAVNQVKTNA